MRRVDIENQRYYFKDQDRRGNWRHFVRFRGRKIRLRKKPGTDEFLAEFLAAQRELQQRFGFRSSLDEKKKHPPQSFGWLGALYFASDAFKGLDATSQRTRRGVIEGCFAEKLSDTGPHLMGDCPLAHFSALKVKRLRDLKSAQGKLGAANNRKKYISAMYKWAIEEGKAAHNPARDVARKQYATDGFHAWDETELEKFEKRHPIGSRARLAMALMLYLGARRGDMVLLGRQMVQNGVIRYTPRKTAYRRTEASVKPILPELAAIIDATPSGHMNYLVTEKGEPFKPNGFGNWFRDRCDEAGLPLCTAHGLKKLGSIRAAENGATVHQLMAIFDWKTIAQAQVYIDKANKTRMAREAMHMLAMRSERAQN